MTNYIGEQNKLRLNIDDSNIGQDISVLLGVTCPHNMTEARTCELNVLLTLESLTFKAAPVRLKLEMY